MKMSEFLALSDDEKVAAMEKYDEKVAEMGKYPEDEESMYCGLTEDPGKCYHCGKEVYAGNFCFGCHRFVCDDCTEVDPHYSDCLNRPASAS